MIFAVRHVQAKCTVFINLTEAFDIVSREARWTSSFTCVLNQPARERDLGMYLKYWLDGLLFGLRRLKAKAKSFEKIILDAARVMKPPIPFLCHIRQPMTDWSPLFLPVYCHQFYHSEDCHCQW